MNATQFILAAMDRRGVKLSAKETERLIRTFKRDVRDYGKRTALASLKMCLGVLAIS